MMMLARKWRPKNFDEVVGQTPIVQTIKNAIQYNKVAQAYLFSGPRGSGKTTLARLLAKAMNCHKGITIDPCNQCPSCLEIAASNSIDVLEIDGASNRGINEVRELRELVQYLPNRDRFKIIIIDEVHMLTIEAFNALLKVLEEPPHHVIFIFATTELSKVPHTITSRCQQFEFRRLNEQEIKTRLEYIIQQENINISSSALTLILKISSGSLRDALSILDQLVSYSQNNITSDTVIKLFGFLNTDHKFQLAQAIIDSDVKQTLSLIQDFLQKGYTPRTIYYDMCSHFRNLLIATSCPNQLDLIHIDEHESELLSHQASKTDTISTLRILNTLLDSDFYIKNTEQPSIYLEMLLVKASQYKKLKNLEEAIKELSNLKPDVKKSNVQSDTLFPEFQKSPEIKTKTNLQEVNPFRDNKTTSAPKKQYEPPAAKIETETEKSNDLSQTLYSALITKKPIFTTILSSPQQISIKDNILNISIPRHLELLANQINSGDYKDIILNTAKEVLGKPITLSVTLTLHSQYTEQSPIIPSTTQIENQIDNKNNTDPIIQKATELFEGTIIKIKTPPKNNNK
jgi:DNA polymerase-3 subunit gamma/tau